MRIQTLLYALLSVLWLPISDLPAQAHETSPDPRLMFMVSEFQASWQRAWRDSEEYRRMRIPYEHFVQRHPLLHCHLEYFDEVEYLRWPSVWPFPGRLYAPIGGITSHLWCPTWLLASPPDEGEDESVWKDSALRQSFRPAIAARRAQLLTALVTAYEAAPSHSWLAGQVVRFSLDARDTTGALGAAVRCRAEAWWCAALVGLVQARTGAVLGADSSFARMRRTMPDSTRCAWEDASALLQPAEQGLYRAFDCAKRDSLNAQLWWLSDPLWRQPGNARRVEQDARRTEIALRQAITQDERLPFDVQRGGAAVAEVLVRYGWPTYRAWLGMASEREHARYLMDFRRAPPSPPYSTLEYALDRLHTLPTWRATLAPFSASALDWQLAREDSTGAPAAVWWPQEHFRPARRLVQLPDGQTVSVRRQSHVEVISALNLSHPTLRRRPDDFDIMLLASTGPEHVESLDQQTKRSGDAVRLRGQLSGAPVILAIEAIGATPSGLDARARFGYAPPAPLAVLAPNELALSDVAILTPLSAEQVAVPTDTLLQWLQPSRALGSVNRRVTLYWESYNTRPGDSAQIMLRIVPTASAGLLRRLGIAAGVLSDPTQGIEVRWRDHEGRGGLTTLQGPVPAQMRAITLDLGPLRPGQYTIDISMQTRDGRTAIKQTTVELLQ
ncbi:MAG: hypothetical protein IBJ03_09755 [Gemmatimonadaceae bacterium]|nr:hypothetical protein [Gemmatimonadaceae bacterium]